MPAPRLEFFYDYGSPFSYFADTRVPDLAARTGAALVYRPMLLGGVMKATGNRPPLQEPCEAKRRYFGTEIPRWVAHYGAPFAFNPNFPINTLGLMRLATAAQMDLDTAGFRATHEALFRGVWVDGLDMGQPEIVAGVLQKAGLDAAALAAAAGRDDVKQALRATTDEAVARGAFGAPTFFVGDEMFWGADRLGFVEEALAKATA